MNQHHLKGMLNYIKCDKLQLLLIHVKAFYKKQYYQNLLLYVHMSGSTREKTNISFIYKSLLISFKK